MHQSKEDPEREIKKRCTKVKKRIGCKRKKCVEMEVVLIIIDVHGDGLSEAYC